MGGVGPSVIAGPLLAWDSVLFIWNIDMLQRNAVGLERGPQLSSHSEDGVLGDDPVENFPFHSR